MIQYKNKTSIHGVKLIKKFEGFSSVPYLCSAEYYTIGYGHKILSYENYSKISKFEGEQLLLQDLILSERAVVKYITSYLYPYQFDALVSFTFNLGPCALQRSSLRQKINYKAYDEAKAEFLKWVYVGKRKISGLMRRRFAESQLFSGQINY